MRKSISSRSKASACCVVVMLILLAASASATNNRYVCNNTGRYCVSTALFDCVNGTPKPVKGCDVCRDGKCVDLPLAPNVKAEQTTFRVPEGQNSGFLLIGVLACVSATSLLLYARLRRTRQAPRGI